MEAEGKYENEVSSFVLRIDFGDDILLGRGQGDCYASKPNELFFFIILLFYYVIG